MSIREKLRQKTRSRGWKLWTACIWTALTILEIREFRQFRMLLQRGIFADQITEGDLVLRGVMAGVYLLLAVVFWREWLLHEKKKKDRTGQR